MSCFPFDVCRRLNIHVYDHRTLGVIERMGHELIASISTCRSSRTVPRPSRALAVTKAMQLQAWVAGPDRSGQAYAPLPSQGTNPGRDGYGAIGTGMQNASITLAHLGLTGSKYKATGAWFGNVTTVSAGDSLSAILDETESQL
jgi:hypothetical protein